MTENAIATLSPGHHRKPRGSEPRVPSGATVGITSVEALLTSEPLNSGSVVAGHSGLGREVRTVTVGEVPDQASFLEGGELVLTSFFAFKDSPDDAIDYIVDMHKAGAAAIAFKPGRFIPDLPEAAVAVADRLGFPIISLPADIRWPSIITPVLQRLLDDRNSVLRYSLQAHNDLMDVVLRGGGLTHIAEQAGRTTAREIVIFDSNFVVLSRSSASERATMLEAEGRLAPSVLAALSSSGLLRKTEFDRRPVEWRDPEGVIPLFTLFPVVGRGEIHGYILAIAAESDEELSSFQRVVLEQAAMVVALELLKQQAVQTAAWELEGDLLQDLLDGAPVTPSDFQRRAAPLGVSPAPGYWVLVIEPRRPGPVTISPGNGSTRSRIAHAARAALRQRASVLAGTAGDFAVVVVPDARRLELQSIIDHLINGTGTGSRSWDIRIGVSRRVADLADLPAAHRDAIQALIVGRLTRPDAAVIHVEDVGVFDLIAQAVSTENVLQFCERITAPLRAHDTRTGGDLCRTLATYLENSQRAKETAASLFIHRNTLAERLEKIRRYTGLDFDDAVACLNWQVALRMPEILDSTRRL